jgi:hypothetical protein
MFIGGRREPFRSLQFHSTPTSSGPIQVPPGRPRGHLIGVGYPKQHSAPMINPGTRSHMLSRIRNIRRRSTRHPSGAPLQPSLSLWGYNTRAKLRFTLPGRRRSAMVLGLDGGDVSGHVPCPTASFYTTRWPPVLHSQAVLRHSRRSCSFIVRHGPGWQWQPVQSRPLRSIAFLGVYHSSRINGCGTSRSRLRTP